MTPQKYLREAVVDSSAIVSNFDGRPSASAFKSALKCCDAFGGCDGSAGLQL